ncbi:unnamed protein product [Larinioides sclopetarius]|uniref:Uncharacterized protein n=1 Tax=Larinioides sclopetarius TaxID=280406 RepID=A0AAV2APJ5_9ARAC
MNSFILTGITTVLFINCTFALPNTNSLILEKKSVITLPQFTIMRQNQKDPGTKVCPDQLHKCPETVDCCQKEDGKWGCCPKAVVPIILGECCHQFVYKWICCNDTAPKCHYLGCRWS